jgi:hypothetical protein
MYGNTQLSVHFSENQRLGPSRPEMHACPNKKAGLILSVRKKPFTVFNIRRQ